MSQKKSEYQTKQRNELYELLRNCPGRHFTAADLEKLMAEKGCPVGTATIYRQLEKFVNEGCVAKYIIGAGNPACFEYLGETDMGGAPEEFHLKCTRCGALIHIHCDELSGIAGHLLKDHHFQIDPRRTVFYGLCETCQRAGAR
jgi:Fur family ferric uptake transcriptional regulator